MRLQNLLEIHGCSVIAMRHLLDEPTWLPPLRLIALISKHQGLPRGALYSFERSAPVRVWPHWTTMQWDGETLAIADDTGSVRVAGDERIIIGYGVHDHIGHMECIEASQLSSALQQHDFWHMITKFTAAPS